MNHFAYMFTRRLLSFAAVAVMATVSGAAQSPLKTLLVGVDHRKVTSLNGPWHYLVEQPPSSQLYDSKGAYRDGGYAQNTHPNISTGPHNAEYDFSVAPTLTVPGDWNTQDPWLFRFEGVVWYQRDFDFQPKVGTRTFLHIGAANYRSVVWINGKRLCDHEGGFTPYDCDATTLLNGGRNFVVVAVDSTRHREDIPSDSYDWFNYGGITRDVSLVNVPVHFIDDYDIHLRREATFSVANAHTLNGYVHVEGAGAGTPVTINIPEADASTTVVTDANGQAALSSARPACNCGRSIAQALSRDAKCR